MNPGFPAFAQTPRDPRRSVPGTIRIDSGGATFVEKPSGPGRPATTAVSQLQESPLQIRLPFEGLKLRLAGVKEETLLLEHPSAPDTSVWSQSRDFRDQLRANDNPGLAQQFEQLRFRDRRRRGILFGLLAVALAVIVAAFLLRAYVRGPFLEQFPAEWEQAIGDASFEMMTSAEELVDDPEITSLLQPITKPLVEAANAPRFEFRFHILENETINAFAMPGGAIVLHTGLLLEAARSEEIAGVVAHEIAHVVRQHSLRALVDRLGTLAMLQVVFGDATGLLALVTEGGAELVMQKYSRGQEAEADRLAISYLETAEIDPHGLVEFLHRVADLESDNSLANIEVLRTHPLTESRIRDSQDRIGTLPGTRYRPLEVDLSRLQQALRERAAESALRNRTRFE